MNLIMYKVFYNCLKNISHQNPSSSKIGYFLGSKSRQLSTVPNGMPFPFLDLISTVFKKPEVNMDSVQAQFVRDTISNNKVAIFSKSYCPYCTMAKEPFRKLRVNAMIIELDSRKDGNEIQALLGEMTGARTVPRVFINGEFMGGGTDIKRMYEMGELQKYFD